MSKGNVSERHIVSESTTACNIQRRFCVAIDESASAEYAFYWAVHNLFDQTQDLVYLVNVRTPTMVPTPYGAGIAVMDFGDFAYKSDMQVRNESEKLLGQYVDKLKSVGINYKAISIWGDARDELVSFCKDHDVDGLVLGSRGLGSLKRLMLGSVGDYCVNNCEHTVFIIKEKEPKNG